MYECIINILFLVSADNVEIEGPDYAELGKSIHLTCRVSLGLTVEFEGAA
jgi:hypothetical protein